MKRSYLNMLLLLISPVILVLSGCATIVSKSVYPVSITSQPQGADITIVNEIQHKNVFKGKTPVTVKLKAGAGYFKGAEYSVTFRKKGYKDYTAQIECGVDGWYIGGNFFVGGLIGWLIVDPATGAMWTLKDLNVDLKPQSLKTSLNAKELHIATLDEIPLKLRSKIIRVK